MARRTGVARLCAEFDPSERELGKCRACGFSLAEHLAGRVEEEDTAAATPDGEACKNFTYAKGDAWVCECGFPKEAHEQPREEERRQGVSRRLSEGLQAAAQLASRVSQRLSQRLSRGSSGSGRDKHGACEEFKVDMNAPEFGLCSCGFNKMDHEIAAAARAEEEEKRRLTEMNKPPKVSKRSSKACGRFELDLKNQGGYGTCTCGFRRDEHQDFRVRPEWNSIKDALTRPKPFE